MISGIFNVHPNYPKELMCQREYNMGDIWKSLEYIKEFKPIGYDDNIIQMLVEKGFIGPLPKTNTKKDKLEQRTNIETLPNPTYINRHKGQNFLVLANGASLKENKPEIDKFIKKYKPVILGANFLGGLYTPDYHAFNSIDRLNSYIDTVSSASKILVGVNLHNIKVITNKLKRRYESLIFVNSVDNDFDIQSGIITSNCRTISVLLIGVAVVMGAERVFVAGMDGYIGIDSLNDTFFYEEKLDPQEHKICVERHRSNERFLGQLDSYIRDQGGEGVYIITPTNHLSFYKGTANYI
jgi:competence transcription factor ComK